MVCSRACTTNSSSPKNGRVADDRKDYYCHCSDGEMLLHREEASRMHTRGEIKKSARGSAYRRRGARQSIAENKLIVCRATGRPLIFPNVIEGVCALFENPGKKKRRKGKNTERAPRKERGKRRELEEGRSERRRGEEGRGENERRKKKRKTWTMQLRVGEGAMRGGGGASGRCVPGVFYWLVSVGWKFRIMYEMFAWTLLTLHRRRNLATAYREPLLVGT